MIIGDHKTGKSTIISEFAKGHGTTVDEIPSQKFSNYLVSDVEVDVIQKAVINSVDSMLFLMKKRIFLW